MTAAVREYDFIQSVFRGNINKTSLFFTKHDSHRDLHIWK
jgi:hypothetical protein